VIQLALITLLARGHLLIEDVPGVGKTTLAQALAKSFHCSFQRIQFTSDLLPSDVLGVSVYNPESRDFEFRPGPVFANVVLADEINRTTPRTQSALLEAMNEAQVTVDGRTLPLPQPFLVIATQNPVEHHGTYPLPESQLDRFLMRIKMGYPSQETERQILRSRATDDSIGALQPVAGVGDVLSMQEAVAHVKVEGSLHDYALEIVNRTRKSDQLALGVSPRGTLMLQRAAQARAFLEGREYCLPDDFKQLAVAVLSHRVVASARHASLQKKSETTEMVLREIVDSVRVPL
jgi:MoxR-like ATPase